METFISIFADASSEVEDETGIINEETQIQENKWKNLSEIVPTVQPPPHSLPPHLPLPLHLPLPSHLPLPPPTLPTAAIAVLDNRTDQPRSETSEVFGPPLPPNYRG